MILLKREIIYNVLLGEVDSTGDYNFDTYDPKFSKNFIKAIVTFWRPDIAWEYVSIFCLAIDNDKIYLGVQTEGGHTKEIYLNYDLKILKES